MTAGGVNGTDKAGGSVSSTAVVPGRGRGAFIHNCSTGQQIPPLAPVQPSCLCSGDAVLSCHPCRSGGGAHGAPSLPRSPPLGSNTPCYLGFVLFLKSHTHRWSEKQRTGMRSPPSSGLAQRQQHACAESRRETGGLRAGDLTLCRL